MVSLALQFIQKLFCLFQRLISPSEKPPHPHPIGHTRQQHACSYTNPHERISLHALPQRLSLPYAKDCIKRIVSPDKMYAEMDGSNLGQSPSIHEFGEGQGCLR